MTPRDAFMQRVRRAVQDGNTAGAAPPLPKRGEVGYQGAGADPVQKFCGELKNAGGFSYLAETQGQAWEKIQDIIQAHHAQKILVGRGPVLDALDLIRHLRQQQKDVTPLDVNSFSRDAVFGCDLGISGVEYLVAETGTVVMASKPNDPRSLSLLPPVHIAIAHRRQILPDLFDLFDIFSPTPNNPSTLPPSCLALITGPSKTGDIELKLVTGVHGPGEIHVIVGLW